MIVLKPLSSQNNSHVLTIRCSSASRQLTSLPVGHDKFDTRGNPLPFVTCPQENNRHKRRILDTKGFKFFHHDWATLDLLFYKSSADRTKINRLNCDKCPLVQHCSANLYVFTGRSCTSISVEMSCRNGQWTTGWCFTRSPRLTMMLSMSKSRNGVENWLDYKLIDSSRLINDLSTFITTA